MINVLRESISFKKIRIVLRRRKTKRKLIQVNVITVSDTAWISIFDFT